MFDNPTVNYVKGEKINDMKEGDTLYIQRSGDFAYTYLCEFISYKRGIVTAKIVGTEQRWLDMELGKIITAKPCKCYLWGLRPYDSHIGGNCCHWFKKGVVD